MMIDGYDGGCVGAHPDMVGSAHQKSLIQRQQQVLGDSVCNLIISLLGLMELKLKSPNSILILLGQGLVRCGL